MVPTDRRPPVPSLAMFRSVSAPSPYLLSFCERYLARNQPKYNQLAAVFFDPFSIVASRASRKK